MATSRGWERVRRPHEVAHWTCCDLISPEQGLALPRPTPRSSRMCAWPWPYLCLLLAECNSRTWATPTGLLQSSEAGAGTGRPGRAWRPRVWWADENSSQRDTGGGRTTRELRLQAPGAGCIDPSYFTYKTNSKIKVLWISRWWPQGITPHTLLRTGACEITLITLPGHRGVV